MCWLKVTGPQVREQTFISVSGNLYVSPLLIAEQTASSTSLKKNFLLWMEKPVISFQSLTHCFHCPFSIPQNDGPLGSPWIHWDSTMWAGAQRGGGASCSRGDPFPAARWEATGTAGLCVAASWKPQDPPWWTYDTLAQPPVTSCGEGSIGQKVKSLAHSLDQEKTETVWGRSISCALIPTYA